MPTTTKVFAFILKLWGDGNKAGSNKLLRFTRNISKIAASKIAPHEMETLDSVYLNMIMDFVEVNCNRDFNFFENIVQSKEYNECILQLQIPNHTLDNIPLDFWLK